MVMTYTSATGTLSNVATSEAGLKASSVGFTSDAPPGNITKGVSVKYAFNANRRWYVLRISYNRLSKAQENIKADKAEVFLPQHYVVKLVKGKKKHMKEPLLPNILFVYTTEEYVESIVKDPINGHISYYYNHFAVDRYGKNPPLTVAYREMMNFIRLTSIDNEHICTVEPEHCHFKSGDLVKIIDGDFIGIKGRVARVSGQQRVVVELFGLCLVATAYIPSAFMMSLSKY